MNLTGKPPLGLKQTKTKPDPDYLDRVRELPCVCCGIHGVEAHHCRDMPDFDERGIYQRLPGAARKSGDMDAVPLCSFHHWMFHNEREAFHQTYKRDFEYIAETREAIEKG